MRFGSVCSGIEAASVAWAPLGWHAAWFAEIEPFPAAVLAHHYPATPNLGDMSTLPARILAGEVEAPDLLCGGTPCQAFSVAGLRRSLDDDRGNLSLTYCEVADAIDTVRLARGQEPAIIVWENVPGVLSTRDNAFGCFLARLAGEDEALVVERWPRAGVVDGRRRRVAWCVLDAQWFGLAQRRRRVFVVAVDRHTVERTGGRADPAAILSIGACLRRDTPTRPRPGQGAARGAAAGAGIGGGSAAVDQLPEVAGSLDSECGGHKLTYQSEANGHLIRQPYQIANCMTTRMAKGMNTTLDEGQTPVLAFDTTQITSPANRSSPRPDDPCHPLAAGAHAPAIAFHPTQDQINSPEVCHAIGTGNGQGCATAAVAFQSNANANDGLGVDLSPTIRVCATPAVASLMAVRRLTPTECERLQGFPDSYTAIPWRGRPADQCPDGPRYRALGNSWAVPVVRWIGQQIKEAFL